MLRPGRVRGKGGIAKGQEEIWGVFVCVCVHYVDCGVGFGGVYMLKTYQIVQFKMCAVYYMSIIHQ